MLQSMNVQPRRLPQTSTDQGYIIDTFSTIPVVLMVTKDPAHLNYAHQSTDMADINQTCMHAMCIFDRKAAL